MEVRITFVNSLTNVVSMRKLIAAINMTLDGYCDHTSALADDELHQHFTELLLNAGGVIYGRTTYQMMESYWPTVVKNPTGNKSDNDFALAVDNVQKIVFSRTLKSVGWKNARLAKGGIKEEVLALKQQEGKPVFACSPSMIVACTQLGLVDEYHLCVHPVVAGSGLPLFKNISERFILKLLKTKTFGNGTIAVYYEPIKK